ncbi:MULTISPECIES: hypothetical protein [unclassified Streptomyces]|uniref:hypothetical protein n=1 Tax=unclassified Streptomyces TaxID=2593676 RepID=UPI00130183BE|nr:hypothetical protein [Streptomyces sp. CB02058]
MRPNEGMYDATDPDLRAFRASGGKLVLRHGLGDLRIGTPVRSEAEAGPALKWLGSFRSGWETTGNRGDGRWVGTRARS